MTQLVQVVAGTKYTFDLVQSAAATAAGECGDIGQDRRCHVEVLSQPWMDLTQILWDQTTCDQQ